MVKTKDMHETKQKSTMNLNIKINCRAPGQMLDKGHLTILSLLLSYQSFSITLLDDLLTRCIINLILISISSHTLINKCNLCFCALTLYK